MHLPCCIWESLVSLLSAIHVVIIIHDDPQDWSVIQMPHLGLSTESLVLSPLTFVHLSIDYCPLQKEISLTKDEHAPGLWAQT